jgi:pimeloyl-ACP methyl ester carboxylesterase
VLVCFNGNIATIRQPEALQEYPNLHVIAVRDPDRRFCLTGIKGLGDTIEAVSENLLRIAHALGGEEIFCFGASAGGYPALRYSLELKARGALLFSPPTTLNLDDDPGAPMSKYPQLARLYTKARELAIDLVPLYRAMSPRPAVLLLYSPEHKRDSWLAKRMAGSPGAELIPLEDCSGHTTLSHVIITGRMTEFLDRLLALQPKD